jgi:hypothetical protein
MLKLPLRREYKRNPESLENLLLSSPSNNILLKPESVLIQGHFLTLGFGAHLNSEEMIPSQIQAHGSPFFFIGMMDSDWDWVHILNDSKPFDAMLAGWNRNPPESLIPMKEVPSCWKVRNYNGNISNIGKSLPTYHSTYFMQNILLFQKKRKPVGNSFSLVKGYPYLFLQALSPPMRGNDKLPYIPGK